MATNLIQTIVAFDLYGTLLSTESIARQLASHFDDQKAAEIATLWRRYQLEYTWRLNSMKQYQSFSVITRHSLQHALTELRLSLDNPAIEKMMEAYDSLAAFPDVCAALEQLRDIPWIVPVVFSNGTAAMVKQSVNSSPDLHPYVTIFKDIITVEDVRCFKPDPAVYYHLAERVGKTKEEMGAIWLVSGNAFDIVGANAVGIKTAWISRASETWADCLAGPGDIVPDIIVKGLEGALDGIKSSVHS